MYNIGDQVEYFGASQSRWISAKAGSSGYLKQWRSRVHVLGVTGLGFREFRVKGLVSRV